jgi:hypothetical protein
MSHNEIIRAFATWLKLRARHGQSIDLDAHMFEINARKSPLLDRLLAGIPPLPEPPPTRHSYPWYDLVEKGEDRAREVWVMTSNAFARPDMLVIDQSIWRIVEKRSGDEFVAAYSYVDGEARTEHPSRWHVVKDGADSPQPWLVRRLP